MRSESNPASQSGTEQNSHPLAAFFHQAVRNSYEGRLGLRDPGVTDYVSQLLCDFWRSDRLYELRDAAGHPVSELEHMVAAADPIHGTAASFDVERRVRKHIGDYALFVAGMYPESSQHHRRYHATFPELVAAGKESYYIVSQFNLFEYEQEAPLFARLSDWFERCILGLTLVREELGNRRPALMPPVQ
jgi:hypothetical protein